MMHNISIKNMEEIKNRALSGSESFFPSTLELNGIKTL